MQRRLLFPLFFCGARSPGEQCEVGKSVFRLPDPGVLHHRRQNAARVLLQEHNHASVETEAVDVILVLKQELGHRHELTLLTRRLAGSLQRAVSEEDAAVAGCRASVAWFWEVSPVVWASPTTVET
eukprot:s8344_g3.t1